MYSLLKGYASKKPKDGENEDLGAQSETQEGSLVEFRTCREHEPSASSSSYGGGYFSWGWNTVSYLGGQIKKGISKTLEWDPIPPLSQIESVSMASKSSGTRAKRKKPDGSVEYTVSNSDTLPKISLRFDTTPSELARLNRLPSHMLFPGQVLFVPDCSKSEPIATSESNSSEPAPQLQAALQNSDNNGRVNDTMCEHTSAKIHLTKTVSLNDEEEEITEHFLKIVAKYITDGQGVVSGVLLVTPHSVMFNPNVSDPLVLERGRDVYCITTPMSAITSAALYRDIAAMAIHDPLKYGRFHLDAATAESLSRQNSLEVDVSPPDSPPSLKLSSTLDNIQELSSTENKTDLSDMASESKRVRQLSESEPVPIEIDRGIDRSSTTFQPSLHQVENQNIMETIPSMDNEQVELINIVNELLNDVIMEVIQGSCSDIPISKESITMENTLGDRDATCSSPVSEDSGISCNNLNRKTNEKSSNVFNEETASFQGSPMHGVKRLSESTDHDISQDSLADSMVSSSDRQRSSSFLSSFSSEVKYWLGFGQRSYKEDEEEIIPRQASRDPDIEPLYLCIRISKKHWCICLAGERRSMKKSEDLVNRDRRRREYWFAIPPSRVEHVYGFFKQWCPNIHNTRSEEESDDDEDDNSTLDTSTEQAEDEGMHFVDVFYGCTPPQPKVVPPRLSLEMNVPGKHTSKEIACTPDSLSEDLLFLPEMSSESQILSEKLIKLLNSNLPSRTVGHSWVLVYSTFVHGFSLKTLYRNMECYDSPMLIVIQDDEHQLFGALCSCPLHISEGFYGTGESFLFKVNDDQEVETYHWTGDNHFFMKGSKDCLVFGSGGGHFGLWLDEDFYHGSSCRSDTYANDRLSKHEDFLCSALEAWTFV